MRAGFAVILALVFVWNSLLAGMGELVFCLHANGATHVELFGKGASEPHQACCEHEEALLIPEACPPCTDLILESVDLESVRPNESAFVTMEVPTLVADSGHFCEAVQRTGVALAAVLPTRGPPELEAVSVGIRRTVVLRL